MVSTSVAVSLELIGERRAYPTAAEVCAIAWRQHAENYEEHVSGKVSRGKAEMMQKCVSAIRKFENGGFAGMETLEKAIAAYERKRREEGKLPATAMSSEPDLVTDPGPFPATDFKGTPPARTWVVPDWIPAGTVTSLYGDGGTGKSLLALQLMYSAATGAEWLGLPVPKMRSLGVFCEDDREELWRRHENIAAAAGHTIGNPYGAAILWPRTGHDNLLVTYDGNGKPEPTPLFDLVQKEIIDRRIELLVIDTAADTFGGNEIIRAQANNFIKAVCGGFILSAAAHGIVLTVLLLAHPSQAGKNSGSGESGSTGWNNAVRSRLYLARPKDGLPDERVLTRKKANYARAGDDQSINLLWHEGVLVTPFGNRDDERLAIKSAEAHVLRLVTAAWQSGNPYKAKNSDAGRKLDPCMIEELGRSGIASHVVIAALNNVKNSGAITTRRAGRHVRGWGPHQDSGATE